jgi:hypothetical protein
MFPEGIEGITEVSMTRCGQTCLSKRTYSPGTAARNALQPAEALGHQAGKAQRGTDDAGPGNSKITVHAVMKTLECLAHRASISLDFTDISLDMLYTDFQPRDPRFHWR